MNDDTKPDIFKVAARRSSSPNNPTALPEATLQPQAVVDTDLPPSSIAKDDSLGLETKMPETRSVEPRAVTNRSGNAGNRLMALKRAKVKEARHYINVALDFDTKRALETAAHEHGIKMAEIVRDAMGVYLRSAGYLPKNED